VARTRRVNVPSSGREVFNTLAPSVSPPYQGPGGRVCSLDCRPLKVPISPSMSDTTDEELVRQLVTEFATSCRLSDRETAILVVAVQGNNRKETGHRLGCSASTVDTYWKRILLKTGRSSQGELLAVLLAFVVRRLRQ